MPGNVIGMILLTLCLLTKVIDIKRVEPAADLLLSQIAVLRASRRRGHALLRPDRQAMAAAGGRDRGQVLPRGVVGDAWTAQLLEKKEAKGGMTEQWAYHPCAASS